MSNFYYTPTEDVYLKLCVNSSNIKGIPNLNTVCSITEISSNSTTTISNTSTSNSPNSDSLLGFVSGGVFTENVIASIPSSLSSILQKCVIGNKVYFAYRSNGTTSIINLLVFDVSNKTWSTINPGISTNAYSNQISLAADVSNSKIYICTPFNFTQYDPVSSPDETSKIYQFHLSTNTYTLLTSVSVPMQDFKISYKNGKIYTSPGQSLVYDENESIHVTTSYMVVRTYTISSNTWTSSTMYKGPKDYTVKYTGGANTSNIEYFEINHELYANTVDLYQWWVGDNYSTKLLSYDKFEMNATLTKGIAAITVNYKDYIIKHVVTNGIQYLLMHNIKDFVVKRILIPTTTVPISKNTTIFGVGSKLYIFDKLITSKYYSIDLSSFL